MSSNNIEIDLYPTALDRKEESINLIPTSPQDNEAKELVHQNPYYKALENFMLEALSGTYSHLEKDVTINFSPVKKAYQYKQNKPYTIPEPISYDWPKIHSIASDADNKIITTLEFRNRPNFVNIKNILQLSNAEFEFEEHKSVDSSTYINNIRIFKNSETFLANLIEIYNPFAPETSALMWEVYRALIETRMDLEQPRWQAGISYGIDAWAESNHNKNDINTTPDNYDEDNNNDKESYIRLHYNNLEYEQKQKFQQALIAHHTKIRAAIELTRVISNNDDYISIENSLDTQSKCNSYIQNNIPHMVDLQINMQNMTLQDFATRFEPNFVEKLFSAVTNPKHFKAAASGTKATLSILDKVGILARSLPLVKRINDFIDVGTVAVSLFYLNSEIKEKDTKEEEITNLNITEISNIFIAKNIICNHNSLQSLTEASIKKLVEFFSSFIYYQFQKNPTIHEQPHLTSYLLHNITDISYSKSLDLELEKILSNTLEETNGNTLSIADFIIKYNQADCYKILTKILRGKKEPLESNIHSNSQQLEPLLIDLNSQEISQTELTQEASLNDELLQDDITEYCDLFGLCTCENQEIIA